MRILFRILTVFFLFTFSLVNCANADEFDCQNIYIPSQNEMYDNSVSEAYFVISSKDFEGGFTPAINQAGILGLNSIFFFTNAEYKIQKTDIISQLFKTEINANAPPLTIL